MAVDLCNDTKEEQREGEDRLTEHRSLSLSRSMQLRRRYKGPYLSHLQRFALRWLPIRALIMSEVVLRSLNLRSKRENHYQ